MHNLVDLQINNNINNFVNYQLSILNVKRICLYLPFKYYKV